MTLPPRREHQNTECEKSQITVTKGLPKVPAGNRIEAKSMKNNSTYVSKDAPWTARLSQRPPELCRNECFTLVAAPFGKNTENPPKHAQEHAKTPLQAPRCARRPQKTLQYSPRPENYAQRTPKMFKKITLTTPETVPDLTRT